MAGRAKNDGGDGTCAQREREEACASIVARHEAVEDDGHEARLEEPVHPWWAHDSAEEEERWDQIHGNR
jgi:hypothetical protein